jgi:phytoene dehydrogenase-like protein
VIVGAGMAGLTAAAYLSRENFNVLLFDKNDRTGGLLSTFESRRIFL